MSALNYRLASSLLPLTFLCLSSLLAALSLVSCTTAPRAQDTSPHTQDQKSGQVKVSGEARKNFDIQVEEVTQQRLPIPLHITGKIEPDIGKEIDVSPRIAGRLAELLIRPGQEVAAGQKMAVIDSREVSELEAEMIEAKAKLKIAEAHEERERQVYFEQVQRPTVLIEAKTHFNRTRLHKELAESEMNRVHGLFDAGIAAEKDFIAARAKLSEAENAYEQAQVDYQREKELFKNKANIRRGHQLAQAETARERQHLDTLKQRLEFLGMTPQMLHEVLAKTSISGRLPLVAPIGGVISYHQVAVGETVEPNKPLFKLTDLSKVLVTADLPEVDLSRVKMGDRVTVKVSSYPKEHFEGRISFISERVDPETRIVPIQARLPNPDRRLRTGMFAEIELEAEPKPVLACPSSALQEHGDHTIVFVETPDGFEEKQVKTGAKGEAYVEILSGLSPGARVATRGSLMLKSELILEH